MPRNSELQRALEARQPMVDTDTTIRQVADRIQRRRQRRWAATGVALVSAIATAGVLVGIARGGDGSGPDLETQTTGSPTTSMPTTPTDPAGAPAPLQWRDATLDTWPDDLSTTGFAATDETALFWGGTGDESQPSTGALLDLATGTWRTTDRAPFEGRLDPTIVAMGSTYLVVGGYDAGASRVEAATLDPGSDTWTAVDDLPTAGSRAHIRAAVGFEGGAILVADAYATEDVLDVEVVDRAVLRFDADPGSWTRIGDLPTNDANVWAAPPDGSDAFILLVDAVQLLPDPNLGGATLFSVDLSGNTVDLEIGFDLAATDTGGTPLFSSFDAVTALRTDASGALFVVERDGLHELDPTAGIVATFDMPFEANVCGPDAAPRTGGTAVAWSCDGAIVEGAIAELAAAPRQDSALRPNWSLYQAAVTPRSVVLAGLVEGGEVVVRWGSPGATTPALPRPDPGNQPVAIALDADGSREFSPPPLAVRGDAAVVWTGREVVVWGGDVEAFNMGLTGENRVYADGAALDPATDQWRPLAPSPLPATTPDPVGLSTSHGVLFARGSSAALWHPDTDTWTAMPDAPAEIHDLLGGEGFAISASANAVLDLAAGEWAALPEPPVTLARPSSVWTGTSMIVVGGIDTPFTGATALRFDPSTSTWTTLSEVPGLRAEAASAAWDGERVVAVNYDMVAVAYDPARDEWTQLPSVPARFFEWSPSTLTTGDLTIARMAAAVVLRRDDAWVPAPAAVLTGGFDWTDVVPIPGSSASFISWSIDQEAAMNRLRIVDLDAALAHRPRIQVGVVAVELDSLDQLVSVGYTHRPSEAVTVEFDVADTVCTMSSTYGFGGPTLDWDVVDIPAAAGVELTWRADPTGNRLEAFPTSSDQVLIACPDAATTRHLAEATSFG